MIEERLGGSILERYCFGDLGSKEEEETLKSKCYCLGVGREIARSISRFLLFEILVELRMPADIARISIETGNGEREIAAESVYKERCIAVDDAPSWAKYMSVSGTPDDEFDIVTLQYTEEGLLTVDENREGREAAFGDDIAIESLATQFKREIYVVQAHGSDGMVDKENCVFFLPHHPRDQICDPPFFLFMKGTGHLDCHSALARTISAVSSCMRRRIRVNATADIRVGTPESCF